MSSPLRDPDLPTIKRPVFTWFSQWQRAYGFLFLFPVLILASSIPMVVSRTSWSTLASTAAARSCLSAHIAAGRMTGRRPFVIGELVMITCFFLSVALLRLS